MNALSCLATFFSLVVFANASFANTFMVTNTSDSGLGSLRQAIDDANANPGLDNIKVQIAGKSPHVVQLQSFLLIADPVVLDGLNSLTNKKLILEGSSFPMDDFFADCLLFLQLIGDPAIGKPNALTPMLGLVPGADGSTVKNLDLRISANHADAIKNIPDSNPAYPVYEGTGMGTDRVSILYNARLNGDIDLRGPCVGILVGSNNNTISSNNLTGFLLGNAAINTVESSGNIIEKNVISGDVNDGIEINGGSNNIVRNNTIHGNLMIESEGIFLGGDNQIAEKNDISNQQLNVSISYGSNNNIVRENVIHDGIAGVSLIQSSTGNKVLNNVITRVATGINAYNINNSDFAQNDLKNNTFSRNLIYNLTNTVLYNPFKGYPIGIDLSASPLGLVDWPVGDGHTNNQPIPVSGGKIIGPNNLQHFPILSAVSVDKQKLSVQGTLTTYPGTYKLEFFASKNANYESEFYLGSAVVNTDVVGNSSFNALMDERAILMPATANKKLYLTATATECLDILCNDLGNTSELSVPLSVNMKLLPAASFH